MHAYTKEIVTLSLLSAIIISWNLMLVNMKTDRKLQGLTPVSAMNYISYVTSWSSVMHTILWYSFIIFS